MAVGKPRFDEYQKLLHRFYEPLLLLKSMLGGRALGPHFLAQHDAANIDSTRRRFLKNLAYVCDLDKGGNSIASIGVEERNDRYVLWLAFNEDDGGIGVAFLENTLSSLQRLFGLPEGEKLNAVRKLLNDCVNHSSLKVRKEAKNLSTSANKSRQLLRQEDGKEALIDWLGRFDLRDPIASLSVCMLAYRSRHDNEMQQIGNVIKDLSGDVTAESELGKYLSRTRHYIGRLGHHIRSVIELIDDGSRLVDFIKSCEVQRVPLPECVPPPRPDNHTHLEGILNRMIPGHDKERWAQVANSKGRLGNLFTDAEIVQLYGNESFKPRVHAEVQVLEHFHRNHLQFAYNDRFIATSKMSCFCCSLYFRFHPAHCQEPETHGKVYINWGPIFLPGGREHPEFAAQRQLMSKIIEGVRAETLSRLLRLTNRWAFQHDSITGITPINNSADLGSLLGGRRETEDLPSLGGEAQMDESSGSEDEDDDVSGGARL